MLGGFLLVLAIGASRVYLGVHYPSDVIAGWLLAGTWLLVLRRCLGTPCGSARRGAGRAVDV